MPPTRSRCPARATRSVSPDCRPPSTRTTWKAETTRTPRTAMLPTITIHLNGGEQIGLHALGGADRITVGDLSGTDVTQVNLDLSGSTGTPDGAADAVTVDATQGADVFGVKGGASGITVFGLHAATK